MVDAEKKSGNYTSLMGEPHQNWTAPCRAMSDPDARQGERVPWKAIVDDSVWR